MFDHFRSLLTQFFPPKPTFTEKNVPSLAGKVYIVTGSNTGVGKELAQMLYSKDARVYIAARSSDKATTAMNDIRTAFPDSKGSMEFLRLDLGDLSTIKPTVETFLKKEKKLHVLFNNAGVQSPNPTTTTQGHETHMGVNVIGPFLFTKLLTPTLVETAKTEPKGSVRVVWVSSVGAEIGAVKDVAIDMDNLDYRKTPKSAMDKYAISKVGNWLHGCEYAKQNPDVVSVSVSPGNLSSDLYRDQHNFLFRLMLKAILYPVKQGAYTELYAGLAPGIKSGSWVIPFGRTAPIRSDMVNATKTEAEGGNGTGLKFWNWTEEQVKEFS